MRGKKLLIILKQQQGYGLRKFLSQKELASAQLGPEKLLLCNCPVSSFLRHLPLTSVSDKNGRIIICVSRIKHVMLSLTTYSIFFFFETDGAHFPSTKISPLENRIRSKYLIFCKMFCICHELSSIRLHSSVCHIFS